MIRDGFRIYNTQNIDDTIVFLDKIAKCLRTRGHYKEPNIEYLQNKVYEFHKSNVNHIRKLNISPEMCFLNQLAIIPGISIKKAEEIKKKYERWEAIIRAYKVCKSEKEKQELMMDVKGIGKILSKKIYEYVFIVL